MFLLLLPILLVAVVLQSAALPGGLALGVRPDLVLVVVIGWGMLRGWQDGLVIGLIGGFMTDLASAMPWGIHIVRLGILGFAAGLAMQRLERQGPLIPLAGTTVATILGFGLTVLGLQATRWAIPWEYALVFQALPSAVLNTALMAGAFPLLRRLARRMAAPDEAVAT